MTDIGRVALAARVFTIAALTALAGLAGPRFLIGAGVVAVAAAVAVVAVDVDNKKTKYKCGMCIRRNW